MTTTTFVTAFYSYCNLSQNHIDQFRRIAETGINICIYTDADRAQFTEYSNVKIMDPFTTEISNISANNEYSIPGSNLEYFIFLNSKPELIENVIKVNPWNSTHFAWIDFSIFSIFNNHSESKAYLKTLSMRTLCPKFLAIPWLVKRKK